MYNRAGYLAQSEIQYYLPDHCVLDGSGNLLLIAEKNSYTGPKYASDGRRDHHPAVAIRGVPVQHAHLRPVAGNTMTFEAR